MQTLTIDNDKDLTELLLKTSTDLDFFEDKEVILSAHFGKLLISLKGSKFDSSMTTGLMKGILSLQEALYTTYSLSVYGEKRRLTHEERKFLELVVHIEQGSSILEIDFQQLVKDLGERIKAMTGKQVIATVAIIAVATALTLTATKVIDSQTELEKLRIQNAAVSQAQKNTAEIVRVTLESQTSFFRAVSKQDVTELKVGGDVITPTEVAQIVKVPRERKPLEQKLYVDQFVISDIHFEDDAIYLDVQGVNTGKQIKYVNIFKDFISTDDYQWLKDSANREPVKMSISTTEKEGVIIASSLRSFEK